jgi:hypothetical protein
MRSECTPASLPSLTCALGTGAGESLADLGLSNDHRLVLETVAPVYRTHRWTQDDKANRAWIADVTERFERIRTRVVPRLEAFFRFPWFSATKRARVDIVFVGNAPTRREFANESQMKME